MEQQPPPSSQPPPPPPSQQPPQPPPQQPQQPQQQPQQPQQQQQQITTNTTGTSTTTTTSAIQNPNLNPQSSISYPQNQQHIRTTITTFNNTRPPWSQHQQPPTSQFTHYPPQFPSSSTTPQSTTATTSTVLPQRGGIALGVPASPSFAPPPYPSPSPSTVRPPMQAMPPNMGMINTQIRPGGVPPSALHQQRPVQAASVVRPQTTANALPVVSQNYQGHGMLRATSVTPPSTSTPSTSQSQQSPHQPWLSAPHSRPPLPSQTYRPQVNPQSLQQRSHIPQQSPQTVQTTPQQPHQLLPSQQQQPIPVSNQSQENYGHQLPSSRVIQPTIANQQQIVRVQGSANQKPPFPPTGQASIVHSGPTDNNNVAEISEPCSTIISKRSIQELVNQVDPSEKLDPDVEDVLVDIAEDFIDSVTTFGCSLAKHRKSNTLEAKDILLHLDRTWNMTLPGFSGDEIKTYKKPVVNDIHKERLALIKKSYTAAENKTSSGPATGHVKGHLAKSTPNVVGS